MSSIASFSRQDCTPSQLDAPTNHELLATLSTPAAALSSEWPHLIGFELKRSSFT